MVPDYYAMLGVDPGADQATIAAALAKCQPAWSSGTRNPKNRHTFQSYLDQIPALRKALLGDFATRAAYDSELSAARRAERDRKLDELQRLVHLRAAKGGLTVSDRTLLRGEATRLGLSADDLDRLIEPYPPRPEAPSEPEEVDEEPADVLEPSMRGQIRVALGHIGRKDLYDALDLPRDAPSSEILARADEERQRWMNKSQVTAEKTAWLEAVSYAQSHLTRPETRARYDRTLAFEAEDGLVASIAFAIKGSIGLDPGTKQALLHEAASLGIDAGRADRLIRKCCRKAGVPADAATANPGAPVVAAAPPRQLRCRACSGLTEFSRAAKDAASAHCRHCGESLPLDVPRLPARALGRYTALRLQVPIGELTSPSSATSRPPSSAHKERRYADALELLGKVRGIWPRSTSGHARVSRRSRNDCAQIDEVRSQFEVERSRRRLIAAEDGMVMRGRGWSIRPIRALKSARAELTRGIERIASNLSSQAKGFVASDPTLARSLFQKALSRRRRFAGARDGLRRCPPDPPSDLRLAVEPGGVRLRWNAPGAGWIWDRWRIGSSDAGRRNTAPRGGRRRRSASPRSPNSSIASASAGESLGYAVFAVRHEARSIRGASAGPVLVLAEVAEMRVEAKSRLRRPGMVDADRGDRRSACFGSREGRRRGR